MRFQTKQEQLQALRSPFHVDEIRQREQGGQVLHYYESSTIMKRLLDVMGTGYSIECGRIERYGVESKPKRVDMEVIVTLVWIDGSISNLTGWGSSDIQYSRSRMDDIVSDFMKAAHTDGIKVAMSKIGVGSELYDSQYRANITGKKAEADKVAQETKLLTCQGCNGKIEGGKVGGKELTSLEVVKYTRPKFKKRLCLHCAHPSEAAA